MSSCLVDCTHKIMNEYSNDISKNTKNNFNHNSMKL